jgi:hypothetical protein
MRYVQLCRSQSPHGDTTRNLFCKSPTPPPLLGPWPHQNFYPGLTVVLIGGSACTDVSITDTVGLGTLQCVAPPGPGVRDPSTGDVLLTVVVTGGGNASVPFPYSAPRVVNTSVAACAANGNDAFVIRVHGANLGRSGAAQAPKVYIGDQECSQPVVASSAQLRCTVLNSEVGAFPVIGASPRARVCTVCVHQTATCGFMALFACLSKGVNRTLTTG